MSLRLAMAGRWMPAGLRLRLLDELARVTAAGFGCAPPRWRGRAYETRLCDYARFTAIQAEALLAKDDPGALEAAMARLRSGATELGATARRWLGVRNPDEALEALAVLYRQIGIEAGRGPSGAVVVSRCLFAAHFSEPVCRVAVALDEGMAAGLSRGGRLSFDERLTAGAPCCRARLTMGGAK